MSYRKQSTVDDLQSSSEEGSVEEPQHHAGASGVPRRKYSIDSLLTDSSSGTLDELLKKISLTDKLLAKPPAEIDLDTEAEDVDDETDNGSNSAWSQNNTGDFVLSSHDAHWPPLALPPSLYDSLFVFQRQGIQWLASLHSAGVGGLLADDMGLGKTYVSLSLLAGLMRSDTIQTALIVAPLSVLRSWETTGRKILGQCVSSFNVTVLNSDVSRHKRLELIRSLKTKDGGGSFATYDIVITTYGLVRSATDDFVSYSKTIWDYVVLDEGHQIKNHNAEVSKACRRICSPSTRRVLLTGTPIMNNLKELWSLFDFTTSGKVLGTFKTFNQYYARHIEAARDRLATDGVIQLGQRKNKELQSLIRPYFLQRLKKDYLKDKLPPKHDVVVWTHLSLQQRQMYKEFVESSNSIVRSILTGSVTSPLEAITWLKKLCGHPLLTQATGEQMEKVLKGKNSSEITLQSAKLQVLVELVVYLRNSGHRILIFSQSTKMLDTIMTVLKESVSLTRIDGSTPGKDRQTLVDAFNGGRFDAMLLSTKAAGCGLTLTGADTTIIYDPSWTPAEDSQAVDRCYRIGQTKEVTVYRLIAAGTVEEKMYEKQVYKDGIRHTVFSQSQSVARHFERHELRSLFKLGEPGVCRVMENFPSTLDGDRYRYVRGLRGVIGVTPHDNFYVADDKRKSAFGGESIPQTTHKILGRSQRVMVRHTNKEKVAKKAGRHSEPTTLSRKTSLLLPAQNRTSVMTRQPLFAENIENQEHRFNISVVQMLSRVSMHTERQNNRKAMGILIDLVESGTLEGTQKIETHKRIAHVAQILNLLQ